MTDPGNLSKLDEFIAWLDAWQTELEQGGAEAGWQLETVRDLKQNALQARDELTRQRASRPRRVTVDEIKHCRTQREALRLVAELQGGHARLWEVAGLVVEARMTKGRRNSVRSSLHHFVTNNPEDWAHMGNGQVWLLKCGPVPNDGQPEGERRP